MKEMERNNNSSRNFLFAVLGNQPQATHTLDNQSATEQRTQPRQHIFIEHLLGAGHCVAPTNIVPFDAHNIPLKQT